MKRSTCHNKLFLGRKNLDKKKRKKVSVDTTPETELPVKKKKTTKVRSFFICLEWIKKKSLVPSLCHFEIEDF